LPTNTGIVFPDTEVEPWVDVNPQDPRNIVGSWQQDRWDNGGSRGLVAGVSRDGGATWRSVVIPGTSVCSGGVFPRASDPWLSFSPDGTLFHIGLSFDNFTPFPEGFGPNALLVSQSTTGGTTWGEPTIIKLDVDPRFLNDKESMTADRTDEHLAYAVWDRLEVCSDLVFLNVPNCPDFVFKGPTWLSRTANGGATWERARIIFDPGADNQTIGNQIVVTQRGTLVDVFNGINNNPIGELQVGFNVAVMLSTDKGRTWGAPIRVAELASRAEFLDTFGVRDPDTGFPLRTGDIIPEIAADPKSERLYAAWQDSRFSGGQHDSVALSISEDGGRTWTAPVRADRTPQRPDQLGASFLPIPRVAGDGTLGIIYYDFRNHVPGGAQLATDVWLVQYRVGRRGALQFLGETRLTPASFDMRRAPVARGYFPGDYVGLGASERTFTPFFTSTATGSADRQDVFAASVRVRSPFFGENGDEVVAPADVASASGSTGVAAAAGQVRGSPDAASGRAVERAASREGIAPGLKGPFIMSR